MDPARCPTFAPAASRVSVRPAPPAVARVDPEAARQGPARRVGGAPGASAAYRRRVPPRPERKTNRSQPARLDAPRGRVGTRGRAQAPGPRPLRILSVDLQNTRLTDRPLEAQDLADRVAEHTGRGAIVDLIESQRGSHEEILTLLGSSGALTYDLVLWGLKVPRYALLLPPQYALRAVSTVMRHLRTTSTGRARLIALYCEDRDVGDVGHARLGWLLPFLGRRIAAEGGHLVVAPRSAVPPGADERTLAASFQLIWPQIAGFVEPVASSHP